MPNYNDTKQIYKDLPHFAKIAFWVLLIIAVLVFIPLGYYHHRQACDQNKQDEFLFCMKCYAKPDTVFRQVVAYKDTCITENNNFDNKDNKGVQSIDQKGGQTAKDITNNY